MGTGLVVHFNQCIRNNTGCTVFLLLTVRSQFEGIITKKLLQILEIEVKNMDKVKQFSYRFRSNMARFMYGRCGFDDMARFLNLVAIILLVINMFLNNRIIYIMFLLTYGYTLFRVFSKNIAKRYSENQKFLQLMKRPKSMSKLIQMQWRDRKTSRYYVCKECRQHIRVPKGKGRIEITCPNCKNKFIKTT